MPVSSMQTSRKKCVRVSSCTAALSVTEPCTVNLTALYSRLSSTCRVRCWSPRAYLGKASGMRSSRASPLCVACGLTMPIAVEKTSCRLKSFVSSSSLPASIFETSRMSLTRLSRCSPLMYAFCTLRHTAGGSSCDMASCSMPRTPLSGVRISCDIDARKLPLASLDARSFAALICAFSMYFFSVMSCPTPTTPTMKPAALRRDAALSSSSTSRPSFEWIENSKFWQSMPCSARSKTSPTEERLAGSMKPHLARCMPRTSCFE